MIVNHSHKFIFIHTPKAAGTSVTSKLSALTQYCDQEIGGTPLGEAVGRFYARRFGLRKHSPARDVCKVVGDETWDRYFTFGFVRDPFTRLVSAYTFLLKWEGRPDRVNKRLERLDTLEKFMDSRFWSDEPGPDGLFLPQTNWMCPTVESAKPMVDYVGKSETLDADMAAILGRIHGTEPQDAAIPRLNASSKPDAAALWTPDRIDRVQARYAADFEAFYPSALPPGAP